VTALDATLAMALLIVGTFGLLVTLELAVRLIDTALDIIDHMRRL
jgi:hypothetical protein